MNGWETEAYIKQDNIRKLYHAKFIKLYSRNHFTMMSRIFERVHILKCFELFTRLKAFNNLSLGNQFGRVFVLQ